MDEASEMVPASKWCLFGRTWSASLKTLFAFFLVKSSSLVLSYSFHSPLFYLMLGGSLTVPVPYTECWEEHSSAGEDVSRIILAATQALQKPGRRFPGPKQDALAGPSCQFCSHNSRGKRKKIAFGFFCERILGICRKCPGGESVLLFSSLQMAAITWGTPCNATSLLHPFPMQALCLQPFLIQCLGLHAVLAKAWLTAVQVSST